MAYRLRYRFSADNIKLSHLRCFVTLVDSFDAVEASQKLGIDCASLEQRVRTLQHRLKVSLFTKRHRFYECKLSASGEIFYKYAKKILRQYDKTLEEMRAVDITGGRGPVYARCKIGCRREMLTKADSVLTQIEKVFPYGVVTCQSELEFRDKFTSGEISMSVGYTAVPGMVSEVCGSEIFTAVVRKDYDLALSNYPVPIISVVGLANVIQEAKDKLLLSCGIETRVVWEVDNVVAARWSAEAGAGIAIIPHRMLTPQLVSLFPEEIFLEKPILVHKTPALQRKLQ